MVYEILLAHFLPTKTTTCTIAQGCASKFPIPFHIFMYILFLLQSLQQEYRFCLRNLAQPCGIMTPCNKIPVFYHFNYLFAFN